MCSSARSQYSEVASDSKLDAQIKIAEKAILPGLDDSTDGVDPAEALSRAQAYESVLAQFAALSRSARYELLVQDKLPNPLDHALYWYYIARENGYIVKDKLQQLMQLGFAMHAADFPELYQLMHKGPQDVTLALPGGETQTINSSAYLEWFLAPMAEGEPGQEHRYRRLPAGTNLQFIRSDSYFGDREAYYITPLFSYLLADAIREPGSMGPLADQYLHLGVMEACAEEKLQLDDVDYECLLHLKMPEEFNSLWEYAVNEYSFMTSLCGEYLEYAAQIFSQHYMIRFINHAFIPGMPAQASYMIGLSYLHGRGLPCDRDAARSWLAYASSLGHPAAQHALMVFFRPLQPVVKEAADLAAEYAVVCSKALDNMLHIMDHHDCTSCSVDLFYYNHNAQLISCLIPLLYNTLAARLQVQTMTDFDLIAPYISHEQLLREAGLVLENERISLTMIELAELMGVTGALLLRSEGDSLLMLRSLCLALEGRAMQAGLMVENPKYDEFLRKQGLEGRLPPAVKTLLNHAGCYLEIGLEHSCNLLAMESVLSALEAGRPLCFNDEFRPAQSGRRLAAMGHGYLACTLERVLHRFVIPEQRREMIKKAAAMDSPQAALCMLREEEFSLRPKARLELARMVYDSGCSGGCAELALALADSEPQIAKTLALMAQFQGGSQRCRALIADRSIKPLPFMSVLMSNEHKARRGDPTACRFMAAMFFTGCVVPASISICSYYLHQAARSGAEEDRLLIWSFADNKLEQLQPGPRSFQRGVSVSLSTLQRRLRPHEFSSIFRADVCAALEKITAAIYDGETWLEQEMFYNMMSMVPPGQRGGHFSRFVEQDGPDSYLITDRGRIKFSSPLYAIQRLLPAVDSPACTLTLSDCPAGRQEYLDNLRQAAVLKKSRHPLYNLARALLALHPLMHRPNMELAREYLLRAVNGGQGWAAPYFYSKWDLFAGTRFPEADAEAYSARNDFVTFTALSTGMA